MCGMNGGICCPTTCSTDFQPKRELIAVKRCVPFRAICGDPEAIVYSSTSTAFDRLPSGVISVVNTGDECTITVEITQDGGTVSSFNVSPQSAIILEVVGLELVTFTCIASIPAGGVCTGTFEADLQYTVVST
ncbi:S-Ena type endospore appendage [Pontibacillus salicampi]|uniref:S-Ena type endospore appendage n=1 Tax=Pontibacillus salicampi TaxID=1449801 RepID=A0ABV6LRC2_9BACI